jgi:hypothetical protein
VFPVPAGRKRRSLLRPTGRLFEGVRWEGTGEPPGAVCVTLRADCGARSRPPGSGCRGTAAGRAGGPPAAILLPTMARSAPAPGRGHAMARRCAARRGRQPARSLARAWNSGPPRWHNEARHEAGQGEGYQDGLRHHLRQHLRHHLRHHQGGQAPTPPGWARNSPPIAPTFGAGSGCLFLSEQGANIGHLVPYKSREARWQLAFLPRHSSLGWMDIGCWNS